MLISETSVYSEQQFTGKKKDALFWDEMGPADDY